MSTLDVARFITALDCQDPVALGTFYANLLGWDLRVPGPEEPDHDDPEWVSVVPPGIVRGGYSLGFQRVDGHVAPTWPEGPVPQQEHLDLWVDDLEAGGALALEHGATRHGIQPSEDGAFVVYLDPAGHPFCLCQA